jgi:hypothetical protein
MTYKQKETDRERKTGTFKEDKQTCRQKDKQIEV